MNQTDISNDTSDTNDESVDDTVRKMIILDGFTKEAISDIIKSKTKTNEEISQKYLCSLNFKKLDPIEAYRKMANYLFITGDSQDIDVIHERFSSVYCNQNPNSFSIDKCHTLVTAFVMLNSDLHSKKVTNKMTVEQFIANINNAFSQHEFDEELLRNIYKSIKQKEIKHMCDSGDIRLRKRSNELDINTVVGNKKTKNNSENVQNFGFQKLRMKTMKNSAFQIFENKSWKSYFSSVDDLTLSLYKYGDFKHFSGLDMDCERSVMTRNDYTQSALQFIGFAKPAEELSLHHAYASTLINDNTKCELFLIDNSKYLFKFRNALEAEKWSYSINYAAGLLSKPPLWTVQNNDNTKTIIQHKWSSEMTKYNFKEQREHTERQMKTFESDLNYLKENPSKKSDYKENLKYVTKNFERYQIYHRTLKMADTDVFKAITVMNNDSKDDNYLSSWASSSANVESSSSLVCIVASSRKPSSNFSSIFNSILLDETTSRSEDP